MPLVRSTECHKSNIVERHSNGSVFFLEAGGVYIVGIRVTVIGPTYYCMEHGNFLLSSYTLCVVCSSENSH